MKDQYNFAGEVSAVYKRAKDRAELVKVSSSSTVSEFFRKHWERGTLELYESFYALYLNTANQIVYMSKIGQGNANSCIADPKMIFQRAIMVNASKIILTHNHPSGNINPSQPDMNLTKKVKEGGKLLEIEILDHIILSPESGKYFSFADEGIL